MATLEINNFQIIIDSIGPNRYFRFGKFVLVIEPTIHRPRGRGLGALIEACREGLNDGEPTQYFTMGKRIWWNIEEGNW